MIKNSYPFFSLLNKIKEPLKEVALKKGMYFKSYKTTPTTMKISHFICRLIFSLIPLLLVTLFCDLILRHYSLFLLFHKLRIVALPAIQSSFSHSKKNSRPASRTMLRLLNLPAVN